MSDHGRHILRCDKIPGTAAPHLITLLAQVLSAATRSTLVLSISVSVHADESPTGCLLQAHDTIVIDIHLLEQLGTLLVRPVPARHTYHCTTAATGMRSRCVAINHPSGCSASPTFLNSSRSRSPDALRSNCLKISTSLARRTSNRAVVSLR